MMVVRFVEMCRRRGLEVKANKSEVLVLGGEKGFKREIRVGRSRLEQVLEFKYLRCVMGESGTDVAVCIRMVASGRKVAGTIRSLIDDMGL